MRLHGCKRVEHRFGTGRNDSLATCRPVAWSLKKVAAGDFHGGLDVGRARRIHVIVNLDEIAHSGVRQKTPPQRFEARFCRTPEMLIISAESG